MASMFDVGDGISTVVNALLSTTDKAIGQVCLLAWTDVFPWLAAIVIGFLFIGMLFADDLVEGVRHFIAYLIPLLVIAWLIQGGTSCKLVAVKGDIVAFQAKVVTAVGGEEFGGDAGKTVKNVMTALLDSMSTLEARLWSALKIEPIGDSAVPPNP